MRQLLIVIGLVLVSSLAEAQVDVQGRTAILDSPKTVIAAPRGGKGRLVLYGTRGAYYQTSDGGSARLDSVPTISAVVPDIWGDTSDGSTTISVNTALTKEMHYNNLTINSGVYLQPAGFRIFVKGTLTLNGFIADTGKDGNNATNGTDGSYSGGAHDGTPGDSGASILGDADGYLPRHGFSTTLGGRGSRSAGGNVSKQDGVAGQAGTSMSLIWGTSTGAAGGAGGGAGVASGGGAGGAGGAAGTVTALPATSGSVRNFTAMYLARVFTSTAASLFRYCTTSGGGGSGGEGDNSSGFNISHGGSGGGGSAGAPGKLVWIAAQTIAGTGSIKVDGGKGGNGGNGGSGDPAGGGHKGAGGGGGGGGGGGNGGIIVIFYHTLGGSVTYDVSGGAGGTHGTAGPSTGGVAASANGSDGSTAGNGIVFKFQF